MASIDHEPIPLPGIPSRCLSAYVLGDTLRTADTEDDPLSSVTPHLPVTLLLLSKENALHSAGSLIEGCMIQLSLQNVLGKCTLGLYTRKPVLEDSPIGHKNVVS